MDGGHHVHPYITMVEFYCIHLNSNDDCSCYFQHDQSNQANFELFDFERVDTSRYHSELQSASLVADHLKQAL